MNDILKQLINQFMPFAQKHIGFNEPPKLFLRQDQENAQNPLGKTAFYDPQQKAVTLYVTGRHPKDILRSLGHELVHHKQNCDGQFDNVGDMGEGYAQNNPHLRKMEFEANSRGSMCLRDFEDGLREQKTIYYEHLQKGEKTMSTKDWKNKELTTLLSEAWGFKFNTLQEFDEFNGTGEAPEGTEELDELAQAKAAGGRRKPHKRTPVPEEDEELEEGGAAARVGNEEKDQGRDRMHADRVHEDATDADAEVQEESETAPEGDVDEQITEEAEDEDKDTAEDGDTEELKEAIKTLLGKYIKG